MPLVEACTRKLWKKAHWKMCFSVCIRKKFKTIKPIVFGKGEIRISFLLQGVVNNMCKLTRFQVLFFIEQGVQCCFLSIPPCSWFILLYPVYLVLIVNTRFYISSIKLSFNVLHLYNEWEDGELDRCF